MAISREPADFRVLGISNSLLASDVKTRASIILSDYALITDLNSAEQYKVTYEKSGRLMSMRFTTPYGLGLAHLGNSIVTKSDELGLVILTDDESAKLYEYLQFCEEHKEFFQHEKKGVLEKIAEAGEALKSKAMQVIRKLEGKEPSDEAVKAPA